MSPIKVEEHPTRSVQSPAGSYLASPGAGTRLGWARLRATHETDMCNGVGAVAGLGTQPRLTPAQAPTLVSCQAAPVLSVGGPVCILRPAPAQQLELCDHRDGTGVGVVGH